MRPAPPTHKDTGSMYTDDTPDTPVSLATTACLDMRANCLLVDTGTAVRKSGLLVYVCTPDPLDVVDLHYLLQMCIPATCASV